LACNALGEDPLAFAPPHLALELVYHTPHRHHKTAGQTEYARPLWRRPGAGEVPGAAPKGVSGTDTGPGAEGTQSLEPRA